MGFLACRIYSDITKMKFKHMLFTRPLYQHAPERYAEPKKICAGTIKGEIIAHGRRNYITSPQLIPYPLPRNFMKAIGFVKHYLRHRKSIVGVMKSSRISISNIVAYFNGNISSREVTTHHIYSNKQY